MGSFPGTSVLAAPCAEHCIRFSARVQGSRRDRRGYPPCFAHDAQSHVVRRLQILGSFDSLTLPKRLWVLGPRPQTTQN